MVKLKLIELLALGERINFGTTTKKDLLLSINFLQKAYILYYTNCDEEFLNADPKEQGWYVNCEKSHIYKHLYFLKNNKSILHK